MTEVGRSYAVVCAQPREVQAEMECYACLGYVCQRSEVASTGCCAVDAANTRRYCCETCQANGCCSIYEYCISCCMHPQKITLLQKIIGEASETFKMLVASITDHFELCLTKCRTSSESVHHENSYRDPKAKHCYADEPPGQSRPTKSQLLKEWSSPKCWMLALFFFSHFYAAYSRKNILCTRNLTAQSKPTPSMGRWKRVAQEWHSFFCSETFLHHKTRGVIVGPVLSK